MEKQVFSIKETAETLGLSRQGVYQAVREGKIGALRIGRRILIPRLALTRLLDVQPQSARAGGRP